MEIKGNKGNKWKYYEISGKKWKIKEIKRNKWK